MFKLSREFACWSCLVDNIGDNFVGDCRSCLLLIWSSPGMIQLCQTSSANICGVIGDGGISTCSSTSVIASTLLKCSATFSICLCVSAVVPPSQLASSGFLGVSRCSTLMALNICVGSSCFDFLTLATCSAPLWCFSEQVVGVFCWSSGFFQFSVLFFSLDTVLHLCFMYYIK